MKEKIVIRVISRLSQTLLNLLVSYFILLKLNVEYIGIIAFSVSFIGIFTLFINLGFNSIYIKHNSDENQADFFSVYLLVNTLLSIANFAPLFIFIFLVNFKDLVLNYLLLKTFSTLINVLINPLIINLESRLKYIKVEIINFVSQLLYNFLQIYLILNIENIWDPLIFLGQINIFISIIQTIFILLISKGELKFGKIQPNILKTFLRETRPLILSTVIGNSISHLGNLLIDFSFGHEALAYFYFVQNYIIQVLLLISMQIHQIFFTYLPKKFKEKKYNEIQDLLNLVERLSSLFFIPIILIVFLNGELIFEIFLPKYQNSINFLHILIFIPYLAGITRTYSASIIPSGNQKFYANLSIVKSLIFIFFILILIPSEFFSIKMMGLGGIGLAIILLTSWIIDTIVLRIFLYKKFRISSNYKLFFHLLIGFISFILTKIIVNKIFPFGLNNFLLILFSTLIAIGIFLLGLIPIKEIKKSDFKLILALLRISNYKISLANELKK